jgi:plastocyanin
LNPLFKETQGETNMSNTGPASPASAQEKTVRVVIREFKFEPATVTVHAGDPVEWKNDDIVPHTAAAEENTEKPAFDSGTIQRGAAWRYAARKKGAYNDVCALHPNTIEGLI